MFKNLRIGTRLTIWFFVIAFLSVAIIGYMAFDKGKSSLERESFDRLTAVREMKATQIEDYFQQIHDQVQTFSHNPVIADAMLAFDTSFHKLGKDLKITDASYNSMVKKNVEYFETEYLPRLNKNVDEAVSVESELSKLDNVNILQYLYISSNEHPVGSKHNLTRASDSSTYTETHSKYHPYIREYLDKFGYYDIFLVDDKTGHIVYSVFKEVDFATSLLSGPFKNSNIAKVFRTAQKSKDSTFVCIEDYEPYHPSYNAHAAFIASPVYKNNERLGVVIFQLPIDRINDVMTNKERWSEVGLGESGETYIVGADYTLRNQSRFLIEDEENYFKMIEDLGTDKAVINKIKSFGSSIGLQEVKTRGTEAALKGKTNTEIFKDYRGVPVLSAYRPLEIEGLDWVIMSEIDEAEAFSGINELRNLLLFVVGGLIVLIIVTSYLVSRRITKPLKHLTGGAKQLAKGNLDARIDINSKDEIGILALSFKKMQISIKNLIGELKDINQNLENKVAERTMELSRQKAMIEEKNQEIVDSINYAQRLQNAILPTIAKIRSHLSNSFILFKPKDIVSGDFYWMDIEEADGKMLIAAVDCTGHGVPGAMVSVVGSNSLTRCVKEFGLREPAKILDKMVQLVVETFEASAGHGGHEDEVKDGMDIALCSIDLKTNEIEYAGANNPLWILRHDEDDIQEIKANKQPIGKFEYMKPFTGHKIKLNAGDCIYMFSDGYADQFGGPRGKKLKSKTFKDLIVSMRDKSMEEQCAVLNSEFEKWRGDIEQIDDVCVIGIRI